MYNPSRRATLRALMSTALLPGVVMSGASEVNAQTTVVTPATLAGAIAGATAGGTLLLEGGDYGRVVIEGDWSAGAPLVLRSADPGNPARIAELMVYSTRNVRFEQLVFKYRFAAGDPYYFRPFQIRDSQDITLRSSLIDGDLAGPGADVAEGYATGFGLSIRTCRQIRVLGNEVRRFGRGMICDDVRGLVVQANDFHSLRSDGMNFVAVQDVALEGNHIHDFTRNIDSSDHADMIQFWTNQAVGPTRNVRIRGNLLNAGRGGWTQSIFMRNEMVDTGAAGAEMYYRNIEVSNNVILNAHLHGVMVGETRGLVISNNTMVRNALALGQIDPPPPSPLWEPQIRVNPAAEDVVIARNVTAGIMGHEDQSDWRVRDNVIVQDRGRAFPGFYNTVFGQASLVDPTQPASFAARPGGPLDGTGIGATWLDASVTGPPSRF
ncbi:right-handed parallel beta-helix repeat-containing protein [Flavimaricola marinus]|uniref:Uncharacterized protein n=1 Tax=Flavimaricola marinus TaxID=1819565 RepID=A0A238LI64_9RHOB|nr:right-handed parallel beta-helix repeat-containing protein [Flavimaricola marinus]SMY09302.1 hypothetical protein LOM8899_03467 [Flavimaricola marinus]